MRLFRRTNSIRQAFDADQSAAEQEAIQDQVAAPAVPLDGSNDFHEAHGDLDAIEQQLAEVRERQKLLLEPTKPTRKGSLEQLDLRTLIELTDDNDEDFERRFGEFAATGSANSDRSRRWMEKH